jgi:hypothetical protein
MYDCIRLCVCVLRHLPGLFCNLISSRIHNYFECDCFFVYFDCICFCLLHQLQEQKTELPDHPWCRLVQSAAWSALRSAVVNRAEVITCPFSNCKSCSSSTVRLVTASDGQQYREFAANNYITYDSNVCPMPLLH